MLFCGDQVLLSAEGVQQGDPLGPLLFCITIQPLIQNLQSQFKVFYLDDGTIGGSVEEVHDDLLMVEEKAAFTCFRRGYSHQTSYGLLVWCHAFYGS